MSRTRTNVFWKTTSDRRMILVASQSGCSLERNKPRRKVTLVAALFYLGVVSNEVNFVSESETYKAR
jgi:hypothetical protein